MNRALRKKKKKCLTLSVLKSYVSLENTRTVSRVQNLARTNHLNVVLKLYPNNRPYPLSPSEDIIYIILYISVDKTGVTKNESCRTLQSHGTSTSFFLVYLMTIV